MLFAFHIEHERVVVSKIIEQQKTIIQKLTNKSVVWNLVFSEAAGESLDNLIDYRYGTPLSIR
jgi:hypothetical protein